MVRSGILWQARFGINLSRLITLALEQPQLRKQTYFKNTCLVRPRARGRAIVTRTVLLCTKSIPCSRIVQLPVPTESGKAVGWKAMLKNTKDHYYGSRSVSILTKWTAKLNIFSKKISRYCPSAWNIDIVGTEEKDKQCRLALLM